MADARRIPPVAAAGRELAQDAGHALDLVEEHGAAVRGERSAIEPRQHRPPARRLKRQRP